MGDFIKVHAANETFVLNGKPCAISAHSFVPKDRDDLPADQTFYNTPPYLIDKKKTPGSTFDRMFKVKEGYNAKLHRDDREHAKLLGFNVNNEEKRKIVPSLSSSDYGHRLDHHLENRDLAHVRVEIVKSEFYNRHITPTQ